MRSLKPLRRSSSKFVLSAFGSGSSELWGSHWEFYCSHHSHSLCDRLLLLFSLFFSLFVPFLHLFVWNEPASCLWFKRYGIVVARGLIVAIGPSLFYISFFVEINCNAPRRYLKVKFVLTPMQLYFTYAHVYFFARSARHIPALLRSIAISRDHDWFTRLFCKKKMISKGLRIHNLLEDRMRMHRYRS